MFITTVSKREYALFFRNRIHNFLHLLSLTNLIFTTHSRAHRVFQWRRSTRTGGPYTRAVHTRGRSREATAQLKQASRLVTTSQSPQATGQRFAQAFVLLLLRTDRKQSQPQNRAARVITCRAQPSMIRQTTTGLGYVFTALFMVILECTLPTC